MADVVARQADAGPVAVWASADAITVGDDDGGRSLGGRLRDRYGRSYYAPMSTCGEGVVMAHRLRILSGRTTRPVRARLNRLPDPAVETWLHHCADDGHPRFVDLRGIPELVGTAWAVRRPRRRSVGSTIAGRHTPTAECAPDTLDGVAYIDRTPPARPC